MVGGSGLDSAELVAGRPRLPVPGKSRLNLRQAQVSKPLPQSKTADTKLQSFFSIRPAVCLAGGWAACPP